MREAIAHLARQAEAERLAREGAEKALRELTRARARRSAESEARCLWPSA